MEKVVSSSLIIRFFTLSQKAPETGLFFALKPTGEIVRDEQRGRWCPSVPIRERGPYAFRCGSSLQSDNGHLRAPVSENRQGWISPRLIA
jgi:hypothetical protein